MDDIIYPSSPKWFIAYTGTVCAYGKVEPNQCMGTGLENIEIFESEGLYNARLLELNIVEISVAEAE